MPLPRFGNLLFVLGLFLAVALTGLMTWADVEAVSYGFPRVGSDPMPRLVCPPLVTRAESASFTVTLRNTTPRALRPLVQVHVSTADLSRWRTISERVDLAPGERKTISRSFDAGNVVLGSFLLVKAYTFAAYPMPNIEGTCGSFVLAIPWMRGGLLYGLWVAVSLAFLAAGLWMSETRLPLAAQKSGRNMARRVLAALALLGLFSAYASWWPFSIVSLLVILLAALSMLMMASNG